MIRLTRDRTTAAVHANFKGVKRVTLNLKLLTKKRDGELEEGSEDKWDSSIWKQAKEQLLIETHQKCAYCETPTRVVAYGDVEHFRPKSKYWWLAYSYENYLAACTVCNQEYKKDLFETRPGNPVWKGPNITPTTTDTKLELLAPLLTVDPVNDAEGMPIADYIKEINREYALIIHPYFEDPEEYLKYKPIVETKEVVVVPTKIKYAPVVKACEEIFGINRKELLDLRYGIYSFYMTLRHTLADQGISAQTRAMNQAQLNKMSHSTEMYAGMVRYLNTQKLSDLPWDFNIGILQ